MYHWSLKVYSLFSLAYVFLIGLSVFTKKDSFDFSNKSKFLIGILGFIILILIPCALFVQHNAGVFGVIGGIQARYFIPICLLELLLLNIKKVIFKDKLIFMLYSLLYLPVLLTIVVRFI